MNFSMRQPEHPGRLWLWMIPILLLTMLLGSLYINVNPFWGDERHTVSSIGGVFSPEFYPLPQVWSDVQRHHPEQVPGEQILQNLWGRLVGMEPAALRALSLFLGLIAVASIYRLGRLIAPSTRAGLYAALILMTSTLFAYFLIKVRGYTLLVLLSTLELTLYLMITRVCAPKRWMWLGLFAVTIGLIYTHYLTSLLLAAIGLYHLTRWPEMRHSRSRRWWGIVLVIAVGALTFLPWIPTLLFAMRREAGNERNVGMSPKDTLSLLASTFGNGLPLLSIIALVGAALTRSRPLRSIKFLAVVNVVLLLGYLEISGRLRESHTAYLIVVFPLLIALTALTLTWWEQRGRLTQAAVLLFLAGFVLSGVSGILTQEMGQLIDSFSYIVPMHSLDLVLRQNNVLHDHVMVMLPNGLSRSDKLNASISVVDASTDLKHEDYAAIQDSDDIADQSHRAQHWDRVWLAYDVTRATASYGLFVAALGKGFEQCPASLALAHVHADQYAQNLTCCNGENPLPQLAQFGDGIMLNRIGIPAGSVSSQTLKVNLLWSLAATVPKETYSVSLQLWNAAGKKVAQHDYGLEDESFPCDTDSLETGELPDGLYRVMLAVYNWRDGKRLSGALDNGTPTTDLLPVGQVTLS